MKFGRLFAMLAVVAVATTACQNEPESITPEGEAKEICVTPSLANFNRATDTAFEEGDKIGLHIITDTPWLNNALFTYTNGALVGARANYWYTEDKLATVIGYYPYSSNGVYQEKFTFSVNADQSTYAKYTASDLMVAITSAKPTSEAIELPFKHALSKVVITIDNQLKDEQIANVWFAEVYGNATLNLTDGSVVATGNKGTIKASSISLIPEQPTWAVILAPQTDVTPKLVITTVSEKQFTFELKGSVSFSSGKVSTATITLTDDSIYTDFTPTISDWVADNELQFGQDPNGSGDIGGGEEGGDTPAESNIFFHPGVWNVDGAWFSAHYWGAGDGDVTLTDEDGDGVFECAVPEGTTGILFCRMNPEYTSFGWEEGHVWNQTADLAIGIAPTNHFYITSWDGGEEGKSGGEWNTSDFVVDIPVETSDLGVVGSFAASNWEADVALEGAEGGLLVAKNIEFKAYDAFKIRTAGVWDGPVNVGAGDINYIQANKYITGVANSTSNVFVEAAGIYDIYFNQNTLDIYVMSAGTPYTSATKQNANGVAPDASTMSWGLAGDHNNWGTGDTPLVWDAAIGLYVAKSATLAGEFKIRANESWATNFGSAGTVVVDQSNATTIMNDGGNCIVPAGTYDVYFWYNTQDMKANGKLWVKSVGAAAPSL